MDRSSNGSGKISIFNALILAILLTHVRGQEDAPTFSLYEGRINEKIKNNIELGIQKVFYYKLNDSVIQDPFSANVRIEVEVSKVSGRACPILFSVRESQAVISWELPQVYSDPDSSEKSSYYYTAGRTLCLDPSEASLDQTILVTVSTCSKQPIEFILSLRVSNDLVVLADGSQTAVTLSPTAPRYYKFDYLATSNDTNYVMITLNAADDETCMTFSIQDPTCPVFDQAANIQFQGYWQTLTSQGSITVRRAHYPNGFFLVFVVLNEDESCTQRSGIFDSIPRSSSILAGKRTKSFNFSIHSVIEPSEYVTPTLIPLAFIFGLLLVVTVVFSIFQNALLRIKRSGEPDRSIVLKGRGGKFQSCLCLEDLKERNLEVLQKQSNRYYWSIVTIGIFYCVPVFQLIINYLKVLYRTGDYDLCYYNYLCARPLGYLMDFNHIYSNIGYVLFGIFFILLVRLRQTSLRTKLSPGDKSQLRLEIAEEAENVGVFRKIFPKVIQSNCEYGVLQHFGLYYALGIALILEGVLSAAYHICPNQSNFQFDTSFMYVIAVLGIIKVYQFRHPIYLTANITFMSLAVVAASSVFGLLFDYLIFKILFSVVHFCGILSVLLYLYNIGFFTEDGAVVTGWVAIYKATFGFSRSIERTRESSSQRSRLILPILAVFLNGILVAMIWTIMQDSNFATQLLAIFVANFAVYTFYYAIMKLLHNEYKNMLWIQLLIYSILAAGLWILSLNYFQQALSSWAESPAESRALNEDCSVYDFYDNHDLWHFTSSAALFCSFMLLLTLDDDLIATKHENIPVF